MTDLSLLRIARVAPYVSVLERAHCIHQKYISLAQLNRSNLFMYMTIVFHQVKKPPSNRDSLTHSMAAHWETVLHSQEGTDVKLVLKSLIIYQV